MASTVTISIPTDLTNLRCGLKPGVAGKFLALNGFVIP